MNAVLQIERLSADSSLWIGILELLRLWSMVVVVVEVEKNLEQKEINHNHVSQIDHMIMVDFRFSSST